jgi:hypothetical protein
MWPMVLGHSPTSPTDPTPQEMVLCYQFSGDPEHRGWRCLIVYKLDDIDETNPGPGNPRPIMTEVQVERQSCVTDVELPTFP